MLGKIVDNKLVLAGNKIKTPFGVIVNPKKEDYIKYGYKEVEYDTTEIKCDEEEYKKSEYYIDEDKIIVMGCIQPLTDEEHNEVIKRKIEELENTITERRKREALLNKEGAVEYIREVENKIQLLREKLR